MRRNRPIRLALLAVLCALLQIVTTAEPAHAYEALTGSGSTWSQNALDQWRRNVDANYAMTINYNGVGSSAGRRNFLDGTVDFAISEIPFQAKPEDGSDAETPAGGYAYLPIVAGGTSFMYNLKINGRRVTNLRLSGDTIALIFTGQITNWNDPKIQEDNPGLAMPDQPIIPVIRSDGSGTSAQFTDWMSKQYPSIWTYGMRSQYPQIPGNFKAQKGSDGVSGYVAQNYGEGAITYVEYSYARNAGFPVAKVLNAANYYAEPTAYSVAVALTQAGVRGITDSTPQGSPDYLTQELKGVYDNGDPRSYPLSSYSYIIVPTEVNPPVYKTFSQGKGETLGAFLRYVLCEGQQQADPLGYSPLPMNLVQAGSSQIERIPGTGAAGIDFNACNNPTFDPGDSPANNKLARIAPQPASCDQKGPNQCTTGTGGALEETEQTGSGGGGRANTNPGDNNDPAGGTDPNTQTAPGADGAASNANVDSNGEPIYDEYGNIISGGDGTNGARGGVAAATPYELAEPGMGVVQWLLVASLIGLVAAVTVPPLVFQRMDLKGVAAGAHPKR